MSDNHAFSARYSCVVAVLSTQDIIYYTGRQPFYLTRILQVCKARYRKGEREKEREREREGEREREERGGEERGERREREREREREFE